MSSTKMFYVMTSTLVYCPNLPEGMYEAHDEDKAHFWTHAIFKEACSLLSICCEMLYISSMHNCH